MKSSDFKVCHVAIIPDGNRRWARSHFLPVIEGHRRGFYKAKEIIKKSQKMGIKVITLWAFSTENWTRAKDEIENLMLIYENFLDEYFSEAIKEQVRVIHIGRKDRIKKSLLKKIIEVEEKTKEFKKYTLVFALDYGGRDEIVRAVLKMHKDKIDFSQISDELISEYLDTVSISDPDLIIRTSGEQRTSGFLLWQSEYSEYIFVNKFFPDFSVGDFEDCIKEYKNRKRRYGS